MQLRPARSTAAQGTPRGPSLSCGNSLFPSVQRSGSVWARDQLSWVEGQELLRKSNCCNMSALWFKKKEGIRKDISLKELFSFVKRIRNPGFSAWQTKTGTLRSTGEGIAMPCRFECFPKGECSCEEPENSCRSKGSLAQRTSHVQNLLCPHFLRDKPKDDCGKIKLLLYVKDKKINIPLGVQNRFSSDIWELNELSCQQRILIWERRCWYLRQKNLHGWSY